MKQQPVCSSLQPPGKHAQSWKKSGKRKTKALKEETIFDVVLCIQLQGLLLPVCVWEHVGIQRGCVRDTQTFKARNNIHTHTYE